MTPAAGKSEAARPRRSRPVWRVALMPPLLAVLAMCLSACQPALTLTPPPAPLAEGDLLFQETDGHALTEAVKAVTWGHLGAKFTHVGIVAVDGFDSPRVIEAGTKGVRVAPLRDFLARSADESGRPMVVVGRLKPEYRAAAPAAVARAKALIGSPYDDEFLLNNGKYYCSELVYETYLDAAGDHLFQAGPMTFCPVGSHGPHPAWKAYFDGRNLRIPEGRFGCNPGGLSRSDKLEIIYAFGRPDGWSERTYRRFANMWNVSVR